MPVLSNPRHERFAQELAKGTPSAKAYEIAGFKPSRANASHLQHRDIILQRVTELLNDRAQLHAQATVQAVKEAGLTKAWIIARLVENANRAMQATAVLDDEGKTIGEYQYQGSIANRALELLGKELGMFIDRKEVGMAGEFRDLEGMTSDELRAYLRSRASRTPEDGLRDPEAGDPGGRGAPRGELH